MQTPLEISYRHVEKDDEIDALIRAKAAKLEQVCPYMTTCRIAVERPQEHQRFGNPYRVRIAMFVPPGHELVVSREPADNEMHQSLDAVVRSAFEAARRQLQELVERQRREIKVHEEQQPQGVIGRLFREDGYGFVKTPNGREIYFHRNSVVNGRFEDLSVGAAVRFNEVEGEKGPQASSLQLVEAAQSGMVDGPEA